MLPRSIWVLYFFLGGLLLLRSFAAGSVRPEVFQNANRLYEQGKYAEAINEYQSLLQNGQGSAAVLFNLANAYFKAGDFGLAIYNYRRAAELSPRDPDIQANLRFARDRVNGGASVEPRAWERAVELFRLNELAAAAAILFWAWLSLLAMFALRPQLRNPLRTAGRIVFAALVLTTIALGLGCASRADQTAVITEKNAVVHLGPLPESQASFTVPDGTELRVEARRGDWIQVTDRSNRTGWIQTNQAAIFPGF